jgi:hypothetical protein
MKKFSIIIIVSLALTSVAFAQKKENKRKKKKEAVENTQNSGKVLLRQNLKKGDIYFQTVDSDQKILVMGMEMPSKQTFTFKNEVIDIESSGNIISEMTYEKIYLKQSNPMMGDLEFDSEDPKKQSEQFAMLKDLKGKKVTITTTPNGKVVRVSDESIKQAMGGSSNEFPDTPVGVGDTWERTSETSNQIGKMVTTTTFKVIERKDGIMIIETNSKVSQEGKDAGTQTGKMSIDEKTGLLIENTINQKLNITIQGMDAQLDSVTKITTKR